MMTRISQSLIQSDFGEHGNFEAVIVEGNNLNHWWRDNNQLPYSWKRGQTIVSGDIAGPASIIQSDFINNDHGNFEVVVPLRVPGGRIELWHFWHDNSDVNIPWRRGHKISSDVTGPASIIQSDFINNDHGNFEVVVLEGHSLVHYWHDNSDVNLPWRRGQTITDSADGPASIIQSDFINNDHGNFEVVVLEGHSLVHYWHDNSDVNLPWRRGQTITDSADGPASIIQSDFINNDHGNFEVVVLEGHSLVHYWHDNSDVNLPWRRGQTITDSADGVGCIIQSTFSSNGNGHGNFEILVEGCAESLVGYWHPNQDVNLPWIRCDVLIARLYPKRLIETRKIAQLTGEFDREGWSGSGVRSFAYNRTESRFGIRGTDLGVSFVHKNRIYFLFGDTWRIGQSEEEQDLDSIGFSTDTNADQGLSITFYKQPPIIRTGNISQHAFEVPLDGISVNNMMYVFFSTNHIHVGNSDLMGRSILARSDNDGYEFDFLYEFSHQKFINLSVERTTLEDQEDVVLLGLDKGTEVLWIWGSGTYRSSNIYLAVLPLSGLENKEGIRYFSGNLESVLWSSKEADATPLICDGTVGELSVRWNRFLRKYLAFFNSDNPGGIHLRSSQKPWGPWSEPVIVFDPSFREKPNDLCSGAGYGKFIHISWADRRCDHVQDDMFSPGNYRDNEYGGTYGPYQITPFTSGEEGKLTRIYFTMSTWNPYQVMLMTTIITNDLI